MRTKKLLYNLLPTLFILGIIWLIIFVSKSALKEDTSGIMSQIPNKTEWFIKIEGDRIFQKGLSSLMTTENLNEISALLNDLQLDDTKYTASGINLQSDIIVLGLIQNNQRYSGIVLSVIDFENFKENVVNELPRKYGVRIIE